MVLQRRTVMQREIKFRAWDKKHKKWLLGYDYGNLGGFSLVGECVLMGEFEALFHPLTRIDEIEIMQYIGLKDRKCKEIYELDCPDGIYEGAFIDWCKDCCSYELFDIVFGCYSCLGDIHWSDFAESVKNKEVTIIGNKFENPELLK
jgi:hypothetical protein